MNLNFNLIVLCILAFALYDLAARPRKRLSPIERLILHLRKAARIGAFGPLRIRTHRGQIHVVGYGQRSRVNNRAEGQRLITKMKRQVDGMLGAEGHTAASGRARPVRTRTRAPARY